MPKCANTQTRLTQKTVFQMLEVCRWQSTWTYLLKKMTGKRKKKPCSNNLILKGTKKDGTFQWQYGEWIYMGTASMTEVTHVQEKWIPTRRGKEKSCKDQGTEHFILTEKARKVLPLQLAKLKAERRLIYCLLIKKAQEQADIRW